MEIEIHRNPDRQKFAVWAGGAHMACIPGFNKLIKTKKDYEEYGP